MQAKVLPSIGVILIDTAISDDDVPALIAEAIHELRGDHHLAPHVVRPRPRPHLQLLEGGLGDVIEDAS